jgi:hypothetical protein
MATSHLAEQEQPPVQPQFRHSPLSIQGIIQGGLPPVTDPAFTGQVK